ncbi:MULTISPECIES: VolA/Pla-1 family phospholipase [unclassified Pseudoalteromonas]|uniref:VolA/Pla-1 family phospholipase n=1 Tax=unclassified Pseudoalteromonas TaxID=194690 RepID=UPI002097C53D|nr:VolA/Pla-1 family phospholipase [Pseudoalteromonas sp. XMcav2-N]MCO7187265.1 lipase [Pseudoalteromonas sp. XMcav2-N]
MKKMLLSLAVSAALAGCGGGETLDDVKQESTAVTPSASIKFDPSNGVISVPNDLLFSGTQDGTLNIPGELNDDRSPKIQRVQYADPSLALGALDGWSTQMPFAIDLTVPAGVEIDAASVATPGSVRIFEVVMGASLTDAECAQVPAGIACKGVAELTFGPAGDFIAQLGADGKSINVIPMKPLKSGTSYITVLTTGLKDSSGSIAPSSTYTLLKQEAPLVTKAQRDLQGVIKSYESAVTSLGTVTSEEIIYSAAMTTHSTFEVMGAVKQLLAASITTEKRPVLSVGEQPADGLTVADVLGDALPEQVRPLYRSVRYLKGNIVLPLYLTKPQTKDDAALADTYWQAQCDNAAAVNAYKEAIGEEPALKEGNDTVCDALSNGRLRDLGLDQHKFVTKYNPIPNSPGAENIPVQITMPADETNRPETGWPVVIMQHGITSKKEDMLGLTLALTQAGFATVAIDHPLHGERGIDVDGDGEDDFNASTKSVLHYMNLQSLLVARDNLRQSTADLLGLRLGLNFINQATAVPLLFNTQDVSFIGHSLGSVVGPGFIAMANTPLDEQVDALFNVKAGALSSGGSGIANFLVESASFGPVVKSAVLSAATDLAVSKQFNAYMTEGAISDCGQFATDAGAFTNCAYSTFTAQLEANGDAVALGAINATVTQFAYAAQSVLGSADAANFAGAVKALGTPIYMGVVVGGENGNKKDQVIPPSTESNPLSGSLPMAALMGLTPVSESQMSTDGTPGSYVVSFSQGHHSSLLTTGFDERSGGTAEGHAAATMEIQQQLATFLASKGLTLPITNDAVIAK